MKELIVKTQSSVGNTIRKLRKQRQLTQKELAIFANVSFTFLNRVENGDMNITLSTVNRVLSVFGHEIGAIQTARNFDIDNE